MSKCISSISLAEHILVLPHSCKPLQRVCPYDHHFYCQTKQVELIRSNPDSQDLFQQQANKMHKQNIMQEETTQDESNLRKQLFSGRSLKRRQEEWGGLLKQHKPPNAVQLQTNYKSVQEIEMMKNKFRWNEWHFK